MFLLFRLLRRLVSLVLLGLLVVVGGTATRVWWVARQDAHPRSDAIVVLGASQFDGRPSAVFRARLDHAKVLFDEGVAARVVTLGGAAPGDRFTEARAGAHYLAARGVAVVEIGVGRDTWQSLTALRATYAVRRWHTAVLVTDPWHSLRSRQMATDLGIRARTSPVRGGPANASRGTEIRYIARETAGYLYYRLFHHGGPAGPRAV